MDDQHRLLVFTRTPQIILYQIGMKHPHVSANKMTAGKIKYSEPSNEADAGFRLQLPIRKMVKKLPS